MVHHRLVLAALIGLVCQPAFVAAQSFCHPKAEYSVLGTPYSLVRGQSPDDDPPQPPLIKGGSSDSLQEFLYPERGPLDVVYDEAVGGVRGFFTRVYLDFEHQYTGRRLYVMGGTVALAAVMANTRIDQEFRNWYQDHLRNTTTDEIARVSNFMGDHYLTGTVAMTAWGVGRLAERLREGQPLGRVGAWAGDWGNRTMRGMLVGCPTVGILQVSLGASRPDENRGSYWRPFTDSNSVSGHVFVGAVPFLTAMRMTESRPLQATFFAGSFLICLGRINNDDHYLSQVVLGWMIALLASGSVAETDLEVPYSWRIRAIEIPNGTGLGIEFRY